MCPPDGSGIGQKLAATTNEPHPVRPASGTSETLEGYVIDIACVRKYPRTELAGRARAHTRECVLMGHCIESGYALVSDDGQLMLLDEHATPLVVDAVQKSEHDRGIRLRVNRSFREEKMHTSGVREVAARP
jgi:hypothetical protein